MTAFSQEYERLVDKMWSGSLWEYDLVSCEAVVDPSIWDEAPSADAAWDAAVGRGVLPSFADWSGDKPTLTVGRRFGKSAISWSFFKAGYNVTITGITSEPPCPRCGKLAAPEHVTTMVEDKHVPAYGAMLKVSETVTSAKCWNCENKWEVSRK